ncbi:hypothetical protein A9R05_40005 (plasmid) [Burkholderia sp. KK1]|nr:hypothetical protein A9R05_40005 [Burkholderia sp. KK1]
MTRSFIQRINGASAEVGRYGKRIRGFICTGEGPVDTGGPEAIYTLLRSAHRALSRKGVGCSTELLLCATARTLPYVMPPASQVIDVGAVTDLRQMSNKPKNPKTMRRASLTRAQLLPIAPATARAFSLRYHLALAAMRNGRGNADLASELVKVLYLTYFMCEPDRLDPAIATFLKAEAVLRGCIHDSGADHPWAIADDQCEAIEAVLCAHDTQLASAPLHRIEVAKGRLDRILKAGRFPDLAAMNQVTVAS